MTGNIDSAVKDGQKLAKKTASALASVGGVIAGVSMGIADVKFNFVDDLMSAIGLENDFLAKAITILIGVMLVAGFFSAKAMVSNGILKGILMFMAVALGTWLLIYMLRLVVGFFKGEGVGE